MRPEKRPHRSGASTATGSFAACSGATGAIAGARSGAPVSAATSRAMPCTLRQCARLGVSLSVNSVSSRRSHCRSSAPGGASAPSSSRPPWSSAMPSSRAEHSMPRLSTPRSLPTLISNAAAPSAAGGSCAPTSASGALSPTRALGAPQTTCSRPARVCSPAATLQTRRRSALGCGSASTISPTTTPANGGATGRSASTSRPAIVSSSASCCVSSGGSQNSRSQDSGNCMVGLVRRVRAAQRNWARKRRSLSKNSRRSPTP